MWVFVLLGLVLGWSVIGFVLFVLFSLFGLLLVCVFDMGLIVACVVGV